MRTYIGNCAKGNAMADYEQAAKLDRIFFNDFAQKKAFEMFLGVHPKEVIETLRKSLYGDV